MGNLGQFVTKIEVSRQWCSIGASPVTPTTHSGWPGPCPASTHSGRPPVNGAGRGVRDRATGPGTTSHQRSTLPATGRGTVFRQDSRSRWRECSPAGGYQVRVCRTATRWLSLDRG